MPAQGRGLIRWCVAVAIMAAATLMIVSAGGCGTSSADRVQLAEQTLAKYRQAADAIDARIPELRTMIADAEAALADADGETAEKLRGVISDARAKLDAALEQKPRYDAAVERWQGRLAEISADPNVGWAGELEAAGAGMQAAAPLLGPYGWIASALGAALALTGATFGASQARKAKTIKGALAEVVGGVSAWISRAGSAEAEAIKTTLADRQTPATRELVDRLRPA